MVLNVIDIILCYRLFCDGLSAGAAARWPALGAHRLSTQSGSLLHRLTLWPHQERHRDHTGQESCTKIRGVYTFKPSNCFYSIKLRTKWAYIRESHLCSQCAVGKPATIIYTMFITIFLNIFSEIIKPYVSNWISFNYCRFGLNTPTMLH